MSNNLFGEGFPYTNFHNLNMDWIIKIAKDFLDQYTHIQDIITSGETSLATIIDEGETSLGNIIENGETSLGNVIDAGETSLTNKTNAGLEALQAEKTRLEGLLDAWYTQHSQDIAEALVQALNDFQTTANAIGAGVIASIPADYTALSAKVTDLQKLKIALYENIINCCVDTTKAGRVYGGVTYTYNDDGTYTVTGTQSNTTFLDLTPTDILPYGIIPGETYFFDFIKNNDVRFDIVVDGAVLDYFKGPGWTTIPETAETVYFRLSTYNASNINVTVKVPIFSTLKSLIDSTIHFSPGFYREYSGSSTLNKALSLANVELIEGEYEIATTIAIPAGRMLKGAGVDKTIISFTGANGSAISCQNGNEKILDLTIDGGLTTRPSGYSGNTRGIVIETEVNKPTYVENVKVCGFDKDGILIQNRGYTSLCSIIADNLFLQYNGSGITFTEHAEYGVLTNSVVIDNYFGCVDSGGNNKIANCGFDRNVKGLYAGAVNNDTHSDIIGCSFNHCSERGAETDGINSMLTFTACQFFGAGQHDIYLYNSQAVSLVNCMFGLNAKLALYKGSKETQIYILNNCLFGNTPTITIGNGTEVKKINCYTQTGTAVN